MFPPRPKAAPAHDFTRSQGAVDAAGITPELRALVARQGREDDARRRAARERLEG